MMMNKETVREVAEARAAGLRALDSLEKAEKALDSARGWGIFDMLGGGLISTLAKHSRISSAREYVEQAEYDLRAFSRELQDVRLPNVKLDGFLTFADFFFDGFWADLLVQQRINDARRRIGLAREAVEDALRRLP